MKYLLNIYPLLLVSLLVPSFSHASENSWRNSELAYSLTKKTLPNVKSYSKDAIAYIERHPIKGDTKMYFVIADLGCKDTGTNHFSHFILVNENRELFRSYCLKNGFREMRSENGYILVDEFINKNKVSLKEIYPNNKSSPITQTFSAKGFKNIFYEFNRKTMK